MRARSDNNERSAVARETLVGGAQFLKTVLKLLGQRCKLIGLDGRALREMPVRETPERLAAELGCTPEELIEDAEELAQQAWKREG